MSEKPNYVLIIIVIVAIAAACYWWFVMKPKQTAVPATGATAAATKAFTDTKTNPFQADINPVSGYKNPFAQ